ncbi:MAG: bifunctional phosphopantothenoylcysteine decarboxylase/phosphopantothenate--cysteine ligase CoaBC [Massiliimalia sp.]|jgi:phosphopantothenoylcysteine decarboxylase/phosphopantothenate--cysteine ligase
MMEKKCIVLGICGGIAAYKMADLASQLTKEGHDVHVIMTKNATEFITPLTFETLTGNRCMIDTFARDFEWDVKHVSIAKRADVFLVAPATANVVAKMACGIADDMLTTTLLAARCPILVSPSMNTAMYENPMTQRNLETLRQAGYQVIEAESGVLACKDVGKGRLPKVSVLYQWVMNALYPKKDLAGKKVVVTAGPTCESVDPVRYLTNHSTGKMGYALAQAAWQRGAQVVLISGKTSLEAPVGPEVISVWSAADMFEAVKKEAANADFVIKAAAVADFTPADTAEQKIKKSGESGMELHLTRTQDILSYLGTHKPAGQKLCGFSMETENLVENSRKKLEKKQADLIVANSLRQEGAGFGVDTNRITLITHQGIEELPLMSKQEAAHRVLDCLNSL